ncbi:hypothetical protein BSU04_11485 [Caballeronia sordidicola]|uniref:Uncharacterized protein n=1 Tax=Caballeronia sordidicola TaxID=196367 RepID=A0A226X4K0_CABSO|nr:hypothetical protein BSU04_11485 [Caballeronia sordidicola]
MIAGKDDDKDKDKGQRKDKAHAKHIAARSLRMVKYGL